MSVTPEVSVTGWPAGWPMILTGWLAMPVTVGVVEVGVEVDTLRCQPARSRR